MNPILPVIHIWMEAVLKEITLCKGFPLNLWYHPFEFVYIPQHNWPEDLMFKADMYCLPSSSSTHTPVSYHLLM